MGLDIGICTLEHTRNESVSDSMSSTNSMNTVDMDSVSVHSQTSNRSHRSIPMFVDQHEDVESDNELLLNLEIELKRKKAIQNKRRRKARKKRRKSKKRKRRSRQDLL